MSLKPRSASYGPDISWLDKTERVNGSVTGQTTVPESYREWWLEGWDIPNFHKRRESGELLPQTAFTRWEHSYGCTGAWNCTKPNGSSYLQEPAWLTNVPNYLGTDDLLTKVDGLDVDYYVQQAAAYVYGSGHDTLTFLSEIHKIRDMVKAIPAKVFALAKGKSINRIHKDWLEGRYGWRTLQYDLHNIEEAIYEFDESRTRRSQSVGGTTTGSSSTETGTKNTITHSYKIVTTRNWEVSLRGNVVADIMPPRWGFNPAVTAWELTPLSFVLDWLVNIGAWLQSMTFLLLTSNYKASYGYSIKMTEQKEWVALGFRNGYTSGVFTKLETQHAELRQRFPTEVPNLPQIRLKLDAFKVIDLTALAYVLFNRRK